MSHPPQTVPKEPFQPIPSGELTGAASSPNPATLRVVGIWVKTGPFSVLRIPLCIFEADQDKAEQLAARQAAKFYGARFAGLCL
jgi:hypothetical protein